MRDREEKLNPWVSLCLSATIFLVLWALLLRIQNPGLMADDSGEMTAAAVGLGIPHPPGYPLLSLLGHLATLFPLGTPAFRMNLLSASFLLVALAISLELLKNWNGGKERVDPWDRILLVLLFFSIQPLVAQALTAKGAVYTLTLLVGCGLAWVWFSALDPSRQGWMLVFLWSLGMTNHWQTTVLWIPWIGYKFLKNKTIWNPKNILFAGTTAVIGISVYLFLPLRAIRDCVPSWGYPIHPSLLYWVLSRQLVSEVERWIQPFCFYQETLAEFGWYGVFLVFPVLFPLALCGMWCGFKEKSSWTWSSIFWGGPVLVAVFFVHEMQNIYLVPVYLVPLSSWFALLSWRGIKDLVRKVRVRPYRWVFLGLLVLGLSIWDIAVFRSEDKSNYLLADDFGTNVLRDVPRGAILLTEGDPYVMSLWYQRVANGKRPDLIFEPSVFLVHGWGWKQITNQSKEVGIRMARTNLFQDRFVSLTTWGNRHPLCYSLGHEKMEVALRKLPGKWSSRGLVMEWAPSMESPKETLRDSYRLRIPSDMVLDPASIGILEYYRRARATPAL
jgi:hypothetical protein